MRIISALTLDTKSIDIGPIIEIENCKSNPRFETVALIAEEMNINLDGIVFHDKVSQTVPKCVVDFFANKSEADAQKYIDLCRNAENLQ